MSGNILKDQSSQDIPKDLHLHGEKLEAILTDFYSQSEEIQREIAYIVDVLSKGGVIFKQKYVTLQGGKTVITDIEDSDEVYFQEKAAKPDEAGKNYMELQNGAAVFQFLKKHGLIAEYRSLNKMSGLPIVFYKIPKFSRLTSKFHHILNGGVGLGYVLETAVRIFDEKIEKALDIRAWLRKRRAANIQRRKHAESQPIKVTGLDQVLDVYEQLSGDLFDEVNLIMEHLDTGGFIKVFKQGRMTLSNANGREIGLISNDAIHFFRRLNLYTSQQTPDDYAIIRQNPLQRKLYNYVIERDESIMASLREVAKKLLRRRKKRQTEATA